MCGTHRLVVGSTPASRTLESMSRILGSLALALLLIVGATGSASAHSALIGTVPSDGESVSTAPAAIILEFNEEPLDGMVDIAVTDSTGTIVATDSAVVTGTEVALAWPGVIGAGDYTVAYRVVSADGHPITGTFAFSYTGEPTNPDEVVAVDASAGEAVVAEVEQSNGGSSTPLIIGIAVVVVVALGGLIAWRRMRT